MISRETQPQTINVEAHKLSFNIDAKFAPFIYYIVYKMGERYVYFYAGSEESDGSELHHIDLHNEVEDEIFNTDEMQEPKAGGVLERNGNNLEYLRPSNLFGGNEDPEVREKFIEKITTPSLGKKRHKGVK